VINIVAAGSITPSEHLRKKLRIAVAPDRAEVGLERRGRRLYAGWVAVVR
jgi:hypothetical protein